VPGNVKVSSSWKTVAAMHTRVGGSWKNVTEGYTKISGAWKQFFSSNALVVDHLVIAGGGAGGGYVAGGGGAGGYRTSVGTSGGGASAESRVTVAVGTNYTITVGAGGSTGSGNNSVFSTVTSTGGGRGGAGGGNSTLRLALSGGSGGGGGSSTNGGNSLSGAAGTANQGFAGGNSPGMSGNYPGAGGGGAGSAGVSPASTTSGGGNGGAGVSSSITGVAVTRGGGGGGAVGDVTRGTGGSGGGGDGSQHSVSTGQVTINGSAGTANTGGGGGGGGQIGVSPDSQWAGGSGVVILSYPSTYDIRNGAGLTYTTSVVGSNKVTVFTAGTGNIQFASAVNSSFVLLETVTLTSAQASVEFANLNTKYGSTYQHLQIRATLRSTRAANGEVFGMTFNADTGNNYSWHLLYGNGSSVASEAGTSQAYVRAGVGVGSSGTANVFGATILDILDPFETTKFKTTRSLTGNSSNNDIQLMSGNWRNTAAVTSIQLKPAFGGNLAVGTRIAIYGLRGS
jgi:hypothetical protein